MTANWKMNHHKQEHKSPKKGPHHQQTIQVIKALQVHQLM